MNDPKVITGRPIRMAMIGGGAGSFIGPVHRMAAELDAQIRLVAGCFSRDPAKSAAAAEAWGIAPDRCYRDAASLIAGEAARCDGADFIAIATPNHLHFPLSEEALRAGFHVMCDKPAALDLNEAFQLARVVADTRRHFGLTYTYSGYPALRAAREIVRRGDIGKVRKVLIDYSQGWLSRPVEREGNKQAAWRTDSSRAGAGGCIGDIGVHAFHLSEFVTDLEVTSVCADVASVVPDRLLDDDCGVFLRFSGGARGVLIASQISTGARNNLTLRIYGESGGISWSHERHAELALDWLHGPSQTFHVGADGLGHDAAAGTRLPVGHPEGFIEAFANIYSDFARTIRGEASTKIAGVAEGIRGMAFVETVLASSREGSTWLALEAAA